MRRPIPAVVPFLLSGLVLAGCGQATPSATAGPASQPPTASASGPVAGGSIPAATPRPTPGPDDDLDLALRTLEGTHPEPFHAVGRDEFVAALDGYRAALPGLSPAESVVELMRVWAMLARERDGHQFAFPSDDGPFLPLRVYEFADGVHVTDAQPVNADLVGGRVTAIGATPIGEVLDLVEPLVPRDGPATLPAFRPILMLRATVLEGLGITDGGPVPIEVEMPGGDVRTATLEPMRFDDYVAWVGDYGMHQLPLDPAVTYLADEAAFAVHELDGGRTLYLRYRFVGLPDVSAARDRLAAGGVDRLILDLRQNPGGDNHMYAGLLELVRAFAAANPGRTAVITDRITFSAAANLATEIEQTTDAVFVGEPMGGAPNFWDDVTWLRLDHLPVPMRLAISTIHWQFADTEDPRLTIDPDVAVTVTAADHFGGRDPALEAALAIGR